MIIALALYLAPTVAVALMLIAFARWLVLTARAREAATSFTLDFIPFTSDVHATELALPQMRRAG